MTRRKEKTITLTQKELDKKLGDARQFAYEMGQRENFTGDKRKVSIAASKLIDALKEIFDDRYEPKHEDY